MKWTGKWWMGLAVACLALAASTASAEIEMTGGLALDLNPVADQGILLLSLGGIVYVTTDVDGQFSINDVTEGLFLMFSLLDVSGATELEGSLFMDAAPGLFTIVTLLQSGQPRVAFVDFQGSFTIGSLAGTRVPMIILGFAR